MITKSSLKKEESLVLDYQSSKCEQAFGNLYQLFYEDIYRYILSITNNSEDAFDITQETFILVHSEIFKLKNPMSFRFWIFRIAKNKCMRFYRNKSRLPLDSYGQDEFVQDYSIVEATDYDKKMELLEEAVRSLSDEDKMLLMLRYELGKSINQVVSQTGFGSSSVKMKIMRARKKIEKHMNGVV